MISFVQANANLFNFNASFLEEIALKEQECGFANYTSTYLQFPPSAQQPSYVLDYSDPDFSECDVFDLISRAAYDPNPCFDIYEVVAMCPILFDPLSYPTILYAPVGWEVYFNRTDVKLAMHAPLDVTWGECAGPVFLGDGGPESEGDISPNPIEGVLPQVIEATSRVLISESRVCFLTFMLF